MTNSRDTSFEHKSEHNCVLNRSTHASNGRVLVLSSYCIFQRRISDIYKNKCAFLPTMCVTLEDELTVPLPSI